MEQFRADLEKAAEAPTEYLGEVHDANFDLQDKSAEQSTGGFVIYLADRVKEDGSPSLELPDSNELSQRQFIYYQVASFLIEQPNFKFEHNKASGALRKRFGIDKTQWDEVNRILHRKYKVISYDRNQVFTKQIDAISLNIRNLLEYDFALNVKYPFLTDDLLGRIKERLQEPDVEIDDAEKIHCVSEIDNILLARSHGVLSPENAAMVTRMKKNENQNRYRKKHGRSDKKTNYKKPEKKEESPDFMVFNFIGAGRYFGNSLQGHTFADKYSPQAKLLHFFGLSAGYHSNKGQEEGALTLINKHVKRPDHLDKDQLKALIQEAAAQGFIKRRGSVYEVTNAGMDELERVKFNVNSERVGGDGDKNTKEVDSDVLHGEDDESLLDGSDSTLFTDIKNEHDPNNRVVGENLVDKVMCSIITDEQINDIIEGIQPDNLAWMFDEHGQESVVQYLADSNNNVKEATFKRQISRMIQYGYLEVRKYGQKIVNLRPTEPAIEIWKSNNLDDITKSLDGADPDHIELLDQMTRIGTALAQALGKQSLAKEIQLTASNDEYIVATEHDDEFVQSEIQRLRHYIEMLQQEYGDRADERHEIAA